MKKNLRQLCLIACFICALWCQATATHIVGGEMELTHISGNRYRIGLIIYFDEVFGQQGAKDASSTIHIFSKTSNSLINSYELPLQSQRPVEYTNPECAVGQLSTTRMYYSLEVVLNPALYNEPAGYYMSYERCCRNDVIQNINDPGGAGQAFYLEFPPIEKDGQPFINSSPLLFPPLSDYACINQPFFFDFAGTDVDGDSLAYSLAAPLNGFSSRNEPVPATPNSAPYPAVNFLDGFDIDNMVRGNPSLNINARTGFLTLTPSEIGLYVFSIVCEEFRDGEKIGEVVRDFQLTVLDCPIANAPTTFAEKEDGSLYNTADTLVFNVTGEDELCLDFFVTDPDSNTVFTTRVVPVNFSANELEIRSLSGETFNPGDTATFQACVKECPSTFNEIYEVLVLAGDNTCSLPLFDTVRVFIDIRLENQVPELSGDLVFNEEQGYYEADVLIDENLSFDITATDADGDLVQLRAAGDGFTLVNENMVFQETADFATVTSSFSWSTLCENLDEGNVEKAFFVDFFAEDIGVCGVKSTEKIRVKINLIDPLNPNNLPEIIPEGVFFDAASGFFIDTVYVGESYELPINIFDEDGDSISFNAFSNGFSLLQEGISISPSSISGRGNAQAILSWEPSCENITNVEQGELVDIFDFTFQTEDYKPCFQLGQDSIQLRLVLIFEPNPAEAPFISVNGESVQDEVEGTVRVRAIAGSFLDLDVITEDLAGDFVEINARGVGFNLADTGIVFTAANGLPPIATQLTWETSCDLLGDSLSENRYLIELIARDRQACGIEAADTLLLEIIVEDAVWPSNIQFPNAFSPNGDDKSEAFRLTELPPDKCGEVFQSINIANRWGEIVFTSDQRDFAWNGAGHPTGTYFYEVKFTKATFKGSIILMRGGGR